MDRYYAYKPASNRSAIINVVSKYLLVKIVTVVGENNSTKGLYNATKKAHSKFILALHNAVANTADPL